MINESKSKLKESLIIRLFLMPFTLSRRISTECRSWILATIFSLEIFSDFKTATIARILESVASSRFWREILISSSKYFIPMRSLGFL